MHYKSIFAGEIILPGTWIEYRKESGSSSRRYVRVTNDVVQSLK